MSEHDDALAELEQSVSKLEQEVNSITAPAHAELPAGSDNVLEFDTEVWTVDRSVEHWFEVTKTGKLLLQTVVDEYLYKRVRFQKRLYRMESHENGIAIYKPVGA